MDTRPRPAPDVTSWLLGPKAEQASVWRELLAYVFDDYVNWRRNYYPEDPVVISRHRIREHEDAIDDLSSQLDLIVDRLKADVPWFHPRYIAHMNSELTLPAVLGYFAAMLYNPNNVTSESAPVTVRLELEVGRLVAEMLGFDPASAWAHITSGGTIANLEALWAARASQFAPLALRSLCRERGIELDVALADGERAPLAQLDDDRRLLHLLPAEALRLPRAAMRALVDAGEDPAAASAVVGQALAGGDYSVARAGYAAVAAKLRMRPVVFVSGSAHYSIKKACNVLGYGEDAVRLVPVTERFRVDVDALGRMISDLGADEYIAAVVAVVGSTEEGAVDPVHELLELRERAARTAGTGFWLHADCAYGGYVASVFRGLGLDPETERDPDRWHKAIASSLGLGGPEAGWEEHVEVGWRDPEVYSAYLALGNVDSATVDPHKLGYVPYPAGLVAFRDAAVTDLLSRKAPYLSEFGEAAPTESHGSRDSGPVRAVGPFILEGSKPGAAAASCWLAHTTIPLDASGHGRIVRSTLVAAARLASYIDHHHEIRSELDDELGVEGDAEPFTFMTTSAPDLNIVCFLAVPVAPDGRTGAAADLARINALNQQIHAVLGPGDGGMPYRHPFYVSRTEFGDDSYSAEAIADLLDRLGVAAEDYRTNGIFVLRSVVMNPLYQLAQGEAGTDYLHEFVRELHAVARRALSTASS